MEWVNIIAAMSAVFLAIAALAIKLADELSREFFTLADRCELVVVRLVDLVPFLLLLVLSVMQKTDTFRDARWTAAAVLASRLAADLFGWFMYENCGFIYGNMFFYESEVDPRWAVLTTAMLILTACCASRIVYCFFCWLATVVTMSVAVAVGLDAFGLSEILWGISHFAWYIGVMMIGAALTMDNRCIKPIALLEDKLLREMEGDETDEKQGDYRVRTMLWDSDNLYVCIDTPDDQVVILTKERGQRGMDAEYYLVVDDEWRQQVLDALDAVADAEQRAPV